MDKKELKKKLTKLIKARDNFEKAKSKFEDEAHNYLTAVGWYNEVFDIEIFYSKNCYMRWYTLFEALDLEETVPKYIDPAMLLIRQAASIHDVYAEGAPQNIDWDDVPGHRG